MEDTCSAAAGLPLDTKSVMLPGDGVFGEQHGGAGSLHTWPKICEFNNTVIRFPIISSIWYLSPLLCMSDSVVSNSFQTTQTPWPSNGPEKFAHCLHLSKSYNSSGLCTLLTYEAEQAFQVFRSVHGCHVSFQLLHIKVTSSAIALYYAICLLLLSNSTCWDPDSRYIGHWATENLTGCSLCPS